MNWCWLHFATISNKVIIHKSRGEAFLVEQDIIDYVSTTYFRPAILSQKEFKHNFKEIFIKEILGNFLVQTLQYFFKNANENMKKNGPQKLLIIGPQFFFQYTANRPKTGPNLKFCSIKIAHCGTYV